MQDVTKEQYRQELVRDAFVNNLRSSSIRMRLLEKNELSLGDLHQAYTGYNSGKGAEERQSLQCC